MAEILAFLATAVTAFAVVAAIYQVESHPQSTQVIAGSSTNVIDTTVSSLFK